ncbi:MAG: tetraacyldisaccharide 4'-kinase [Phycisphaerae bacterium]|jgi:tetraacyldisaccharide 4'-kinase
MFDQRQILDILSGRRKDAGARALRGALIAASLPYAGAMWLRRLAYRKGLLPGRSCGAAVICVGNITAGGTGKTPTVAWLVGQLQATGARVAVLTRGYKAQSGGSDEAQLLSRLLGPDVPVIVNPDRQAGARQAIAAGARVLVMDDGFQHRRLRRDMDIVLIDATNPFGYGFCLPGGLLREPPSALADAHAIILTHADAVDSSRLEAIRRRLAHLAPKASISLARHEPTGLVDAAGAAVPLSALAGKKVLAFCGLGNPEAFFGALPPLGAEVVAKVAFDDHAAYGPGDLETLRAQARQAGAQVMVATAKDAVKLPRQWCDQPVWTLEMRIDITLGRDELMRQVRIAGLP